MTVDDVAPLIGAEVQKAVAAIPVAKDGKDGVGLAGALIDRDGSLVLTLSDGAVKSLGPVVGRGVDMADVAKLVNAELAIWPRPKDGVDGVGFDELDLVFVDQRPVLRFVRGEQVKEFPLHTPAYQGVYKEGTAYKKGDGVSYAHAYWIARDDTAAKPGVGETPWIMAVKGRDGREGKQGPQGIQGLKGKDGRDLTDLSGRTW